ncbi:hypothetical protein KAR91_64200 [Candidatus Pacearchaeota archaeon]|nr:hypothetical protein [Candidatus Pacearchaeota archaeon]
MKRCFEVCDTLFPCFVKGEWKRPIQLNDFVSNYLFDHWIVPPEKMPTGIPKTQDQKIKAAREKRSRSAG